MIQRPEPSCPICRGKGWFETGVYGDTYDPQPCPNCNPIQPIPRYVWVLLWLVAVLVLCACIAGGAA
jgi:hypothetical protein